MATVDKNFRIKHGLVVEGTTGTINGNNIITESSGDSYILNLVGGATLVKSVDSVFTVDVSGNLTLNYSSGLSKDVSGLIIDRSTVDTWYDAAGSAATAQQNAIDAIPTFAYPLELNDGTNEVHVRIDGLTLTSVSDSMQPSKSNIQVALATNGGLTTEFMNGIKLDYTTVESQLISDGFAKTSDITDALSTFGSQTSTDIQDAITTAEGYTDTALQSYTPTSSLDSTISGYGYAKTSDIPGVAGNLFINGSGNIEISEGALSSDMAGYLTDGTSYTSNTGGTIDVNISALESKLTNDGFATQIDVYGAINGALLNSSGGQAFDNYGAAATAESNANQYTDTAVANVVGLAPAALDTLQELAAAFNNSPDTLTNLITTVGGKQDSLSPGNGIDISTNTITAKISSGNGIGVDIAGGLTVDRSATDGWYDASGAAATAESNANSYTDTAVGNIASAGTQIDGTTITPEAVILSSITKQIASKIEGVNAVDTGSTVMGWSASAYRTAKLLIKFKSGVHTQVSELLLTLDTSNNVAVTEYGEVGTNGSLGTINAIYHQSGNVFITVDAVYDNTDVLAYATLIV